MKAIQMSEFGGPDVLRLVDIPAPAMASSDVLVQVQAAGVNFPEAFVRSGAYGEAVKLPAVLGVEVVGVVAQVGADVQGLAPGDRVAGAIFASGGMTGGYAEYAAVPADRVVKLPEGVSYEQAAALMLQGYTALRMVRQAEVEGKRVFVHAAAGGVGSIILQLARAYGAAKVVGGVGSAEKVDIARRFGADAAVSYGREGWIEDLIRLTDGHGPDTIYDAAGGEVTLAGLEAIAPDGTLVIYGLPTLTSLTFAPAQMMHLAMKNLVVRGFSIMPGQSPADVVTGLSELFQLCAQKRLTPPPTTNYPFAKAGAAHRDFEARRTTGKVVLHP